MAGTSRSSSKGRLLAWGIVELADHQVKMGSTRELHGRTDPVLIGILAFNVSMLLIPAIGWAEAPLADSNAVDSSESTKEVPSSSSDGATTKPARWSVPIQDLAYLSHLNLGGDGSTAPYIMDDDLLVKIPIPIGNGFFIINRLESRNRTFVYSRPEAPTVQRKLTDLHFLRYSISLSIPQNKNWSHIVTAGWGYGGDFRSFSASDGSKYILSYLAMWKDMDKKLQVGFGVALGTIKDYYIPIPVVLLTWQIVNDLILKVTLPKELVLRYSINRICLFGVFSRLNSNRYHLSADPEVTNTEQLYMKDGRVDMLRFDMGADFHVRLWKSLYLRLEGGASFSTEVKIPDMILSDASEQPEVVEQKIDAHWTWFAGGGLFAIF